MKYKEAKKAVKGESGSKNARKIQGMLGRVKFPAPLPDNWKGRGGRPPGL